MRKQDFFRAFGVAVHNYKHGRQIQKDGLGAVAAAIRAGIPRSLVLPHTDIISSTVERAAHTPQIIALEAENAWRACTPMWKRLLSA